MIGSKLAHYEITRRLGSGAMGDVFEARDTRLGRTLAIKFLPEAFVQDTERVGRLQRQCRVLASLNNPNIAGTMLEESEGGSFLVMELVAGETVASRIVRGPVPPEEAFRIAIQLAEALRAAHTNGIIHGDLKPANVMLSDGGAVKVLDFGLAAGTVTGVGIETAAYISPEQARGQSVDKRADIWAFGVMLYEILTGRRLFAAKDISETFRRIIRDEPDCEEIPREARPLLWRCLEKDPKRRQHDIGDTKFALERALTAWSASSARTARRRQEKWGLIPSVIFTMVLLAIAAAAVVGFWRTGPGINAP